MSPTIPLKAVMVGLLLITAIIVLLLGGLTMPKKKQVLVY